MLPQVANLVIIDNSESAAAIAYVAETANALQVMVVANGGNRGLGHALNRGVHWARQLGYTHVLLLDQDSTVNPDMVSATLQAREAVGGGRVIVGANFVDINSGKPWIAARDAPEQLVADVTSLTTSGTILSSNDVDQLGDFCEALFVDLVDMEYSLRAREAGYRLVATVRPLMTHEVGSKTPARLFGRTVWPSHHSPLRRRLMARNTVLLLRRYARRQPHWAVREVTALGKSLLLVILFERQRLIKVQRTIAGLVDGFRMRLPC